MKIEKEMESLKICNRQITSQGEPLMKEDNTFLLSKTTGWIIDWLWSIWNAFLCNINSIYRRTNGWKNTRVTRKENRAI